MVAELRSQLNELNARIESLSERANISPQDLAEIQALVDYSETFITDLQGQVEVLSGRANITPQALADLQAQIEDLSGRANITPQDLIDLQVQIANLQDRLNELENLPEPEPEPEPELQPEAHYLPLPWIPDYNSFIWVEEEGGFVYLTEYGLDQLPQLAADDARQAPIYHDAYIDPSAGLSGQDGGGIPYLPGDKLIVGVDQGQEHIGDLPFMGKHGEFDVRYGQLNDGAGANTLMGYLSQMGNVVQRHADPPSVRFGGRADTADANRLIRAVQLVNAALPMNARMDMPSSSASSNSQNGIYVEFAPRSSYTEKSLWGTTYNRTQSYSLINVNKAYTDYGDRQAVILLAHELMHALGIQRHAEGKFATIMEGSWNDYWEYQSVDGVIHPQPLSLLYPVDREALRALYGRLQNGDSPTDFGAWDSESTHLHGNGQHAAFGVAMRNGYSEPYAYGYMPNSDLAGNPALAGTATWEGLLFGFTPDAAPVTGDAALSIILDTLTGSADFTSLESWSAGEAPGDAGTGMIWGDGDLSYSIAVTYNTFRQTVGDDGILTGAFFGPAHEGMGGTLEREDLTAAFGGTR